VPGDSAALHWLALAVGFPEPGARWCGPEADSLEPAVRLYARALLYDWLAHSAALLAVD
jgi:hypothetical protein